MRVFSSLVFAGAVQAQVQYDAGIYADPEGSVGFAFPVIEEPFTVNAVAFGLDGQAKAFELSINGLHGTPSFVIETVFPGNPLNTEYCLPDYIVGFGLCIEDTESIALVVLTILPVGVFAPDTEICIGGTTPSSFNGEPGYQNCNDEITPLTLAPPPHEDYPDGCMIINPTLSVPTSSVSFGELKARFH